MGRSWPSFGHEECLLGKYLRAENGTIFDYEHNDGVLEAYDTLDLTSVESIKAWLEPQKSKTLNCWTCDDCDFKLEAVQEDGSTNTYHFLEYR